MYMHRPWLIEKESHECLSCSGFVDLLSRLFLGYSIFYLQFLGWNFICLWQFTATELLTITAATKSTGDGTLVWEKEAPSIVCFVVYMRDCWVRTNSIDSHVYRHWIQLATASERATPRIQQHNSHQRLFSFLSNMSHALYLVYFSFY